MADVNDLCDDDCYYQFMLDKFCIYTVFSIAVFCVCFTLWLSIEKLVDLYQYLTRGRGSVPKPAKDYGAMDKIEV